MDTPEKAEDNAKAFTPEQQLKNDANRVWARFAYLSKKLMDAGTHPLLPNEKGYIYTSPALNVGREKELYGTAGLLLKMERADKGWKSNMWISPHTASELGYQPDSSFKPVTVIFDQMDANGSWKPYICEFYNLDAFGEKKNELYALATMQVRKKEFENYLSHCEKEGKTPKRTEPYLGPINHEPKKGAELINVNIMDSKQYIKSYAMGQEQKQNLKVDPRAAKHFADEFSAVVHKTITGKDGKPKMDIYAAKNFCNTAFSEHRNEKKLSAELKKLNNNLTAAAEKPSKEEGRSL